MEHHGYARNAGAVFSLKHHLVFCPKYRKAVLLGPVAERLQGLLAAKADALHVTLHTLAVMPDHVHLCIESDPGMAPAKLAAHLRAILRVCCGKNFGSGARHCPRCGAEASTLAASGRSRQRPSDATSSVRKEGPKRPSADAVAEDGRRCAKPTNTVSTLLLRR
jgi:REP element-mobilizing transposase RayT